MKITYQNYPEQKSNINWSKLPDTVKDAKGEMEMYYDLYNDNAELKQMFEDIANVINKSQKKEPAPKKGQKQGPETKKSKEKYTIEEYEFEDGRYVVLDKKGNDVLGEHYSLEDFCI